MLHNNNNGSGRKPKSIASIFFHFTYGLTGGAVSMRASAIAFQFLLAAPPVALLLLTLIPLVTGENIQTELFAFARDVMPGRVYAIVTSLLSDVMEKRPGLSLVGLGFSLLFASNGLDGIMRAFDTTAHDIPRRTLLNRKKMSIVLVLLLFILFTAAVLIFMISKTVINVLVPASTFMRPQLIYTMINIGRWVFITLCIYGFITLLYLFAPAQRPNWRDINPGIIVATVSILVVSLIFSFVVNQFGHFNRLFGSLGTLIVTLLWLKMNALAIILGFEFTMSVSSAK